MKRLGMFLLVAAIAPALAAPPMRIPFPDPRVDTLLVPADTPLHFKGWTHGDMPIAKFDGKFKLVGSYYYGDSQFNEEPKFSGEAYFIPSNPNSLPHFLRRSDPTPIQILNAETFVSKLASPSMLRKVRRKNGGFITGHAAIWADHFTAYIECDGPNYTARFVSFVEPSKAKLSATDSNSGC